MKFRTKLLAILFIAIPVTAYGASYTLVSANYPINVNGENTGIQALNYQGTTYLPLRSISEAVGVPIEWNSAKKSVEITTLDLDRLKESTVMIYADDGKTQVQGSAVAIDYDQYLTAYHVVDENRSNVKTSDKAQLTIDDFDSTIDIATLNSSAKVKPVKIGDSDEVKVGDKVVVISAPNYKEDTVTYATVKKLTNEIVITAISNGGSSGGAVFNMKGELIGILIAGDDGLSETYITTINDIREKL
jgi:S1-C subfamily serine protease